jgi:Uma2 family endonuclease
MSTAEKILLTPQEYLAKERQADFRSEFYRGEMLAMAGASREHTRIKDNVARHSGNQLQGGPCEVYTSDLRVKITATGLYTYPDVLIVCDEPARFKPGLSLPGSARKLKTWRRMERFARGLQAETPSLVGIGRNGDLPSADEPRPFGRLETRA